VRYWVVGLPPAVLAQMKTPVATPDGPGYGLGLLVADSPCGPLFGHDGGIPGFTNIIFSSHDGGHEFAVMFNANAAPAAVDPAFARATEQAFREAFASEPCAAAAPDDQLAHARSRRGLPAELNLTDRAGRLEVRRSQ
jgi:hypothetical protein